MAFDGHQSTFSNSPFPTYQRQAGGNNGSKVLSFSIPSVSVQEQDTAPYIAWSHNAHDDPYGLIKSAQRTKSRKPTDNTDCDGEADLQGLVSNILDEADSQDSYCNEGSLPTCNPIWSPKTLREELLQYFQSEVKTQNNPTFPLNYASCEALSKAQGQSVDKDVQDFCQQSNGLATSQQWLFNLPNADRDSSTLRPQKPPPGLAMPNMENTCLSQMQQSKYDNAEAERERRNSQTLNKFSDLSDVFRPQSEINNPCFHPYYEDQCFQSCTKPISNDQHLPQDINQLVNSFQSFMAGEHDSLCCGDFPDMHRQTVGMQHEDSMVEQWKITSPEMSTQGTPAVQTQKQGVGEFGRVQMQRNGGLRNQTFKYDAFQDLHDFSPHNTERSQQPNPFSGSFNLSNQYQNKMTMHRGATSFPINMNMNQYSKHHIQQRQIQSRMKPQMLKEKKRTHMAGCLGEGFSTRSQSNANMRAGDRRPAHSHYPYFFRLQSQRFDGESSMASAGNTQQFMPLVYPVNDPRGHSSVPINSSNFTSRSTLPYGSSAPVMDMGDMMSASESAAFNSYVSDMMTCRGENTYHGTASAMAASMEMNQGGPVIHLYFYLDECYEQFRCLERERKKTEAILTKTFLEKRTATVTHTKLPRTPPNPTRLDHLLVNQMREQARVARLLERIEGLYNIPLPINIHTALNRHRMAICITQARRKEEIANMSKHQRRSAHFTEDTDTLLLAAAVKDLAATTRKLCTALWCALQMALPKPVKRQDHHVDKEAKGTAERCPSPFDRYSFKL
ncbi:uncharacterized protein moto [Chaetodon auriga]|uniref:uncharacterized protein moto n=1 Tax=Chaetodon auriga TaxID=39042 RepID=UPI004032A92E